MVGFPLHDITNEDSTRARGALTALSMNKDDLMVFIVEGSGDTSIPFSEGIAAWRDDLAPSGSGSSPPGRGRGGGSGKCAHGVSYRASDDVRGADCEGGRGGEVDGGGGGKVTSPCCGLAAWILEPRGRRCVVAEVGSQFALACGVDRARGLSRHATRRRVSVDSGEMVHDDFGPQHLHDGPIFRVSVR